MSFGGGSSGGGQTTTQSVQPYAAAQPALNQIISEAGRIYGTGVGEYVAPTQQTLTGLAGQETLGTAAQQQLASTLAGAYQNPYLNPLIQKAAGDVYTSVAQQFSGAGRTPTSPLAQQQVATQVAQQALPFAFQAAEAERGRQLQVARETPSLVQTGQQLYKLKANDVGNSDYFGATVAIKGNYAIIGAYGKDDIPSNSGAAYIFDVTTETQIKKIKKRFIKKGSIKYSFSHFDLYSDIYFTRIKKNNFTKSKWLRVSHYTKSRLPTVMKKIVKQALVNSE